MDERVLTFVLNAFWQVPAAIAAGLLGDLLLHRAPARHSHALWVAVLVAAVALPAASLWTPDLPESAAAPTSAATAGDWTGWLPSGGNQPAAVSPAVSTIVALLYGLSVAVHGIRLGRAWRRADRLTRGAHPLSIPEEIASRCRAALRLPGVEILGSPEVPGPVTVGARRPLILLPSRFLDSASPEELTAALGHEMAHVRRRDYALHLLCEVLLLPVAFHPAAWLLRRRLAQTREMACDEAALETLVRPRAYARSLLSLAASAAGLPRPSTTLGVLDAHTLEVRMKRILDHGPRLGTRPARAVLGAALLLLSGTVAASTLFSVEAVAAGTESLSPFVGIWSGDWLSDQEGGKTMRALDVEVHPDGRIVTTWYRYQKTPDAKPQKVVHPVTGYTVEGGLLRIETRIEGFTFGDKPPGTAEIQATLELEGRDKAVYQSLSNSYLDALKKRGEPVPPPPPPIPMKRQS